MHRSLLGITVIDLKIFDRADAETGPIGKIFPDRPIKGAARAASATSKLSTAWSREQGSAAACGGSHRPCPRAARLPLEIVKRSEHGHGFVVLPKSWIMEWTFAWLGRRRRLATIRPTVRTYRKAKERPING